jgi:rhamnosyltransferase
MGKTGIDVVIPVYKPDQKLRSLLLQLTHQTVRPDEILLVNTERELFDESCVEGMDQVRVIHIRKNEFDHGGTRHMAAMKLQGAFLLFLTQDAVPADEHLIERLLAPFEDERVGVSYARQLPAADCSVIEQYTRSFNYGEKSRIKTKADLPALGIKTFFCSNVCAMYRRSAYEALGGFERKTIFNEDMIFAGKLIQNGWFVAYCADAQVIHSHNYTGLQQLHRNFDLGVSQAEHPEIFAGVPSEGEGIRMVKQTAAYLCRSGQKRLLPELVIRSGCKFIGYRLGKAWRKLPDGVVRWCTMNPGYWN